MIVSTTVYRPEIKNFYPRVDELDFYLLIDRTDHQMWFPAETIQELCAIEHMGDLWECLKLSPYTFHPRLFEEDLLLNFADTYEAIYQFNPVFFLMYDFSFFHYVQWRWGYSYRKEGWHVHRPKNFTICQEEF